MLAFVITLEGNDYSETCAQRCIDSADIEVKRFPAVNADEAEGIMRWHGLRWTWANNNTSAAVCPITGLKQHPYGTLAPKIGCSMSHYLLWSKCAELNEPILILEHDAVFIRSMPEVEFNGICQINDPDGATPHGAEYSRRIKKRGPGVYLKTLIRPDPKMPDGLAGNSAYLIKPWAAVELMDAFHRLGVWPNDATMCVQLFPWLQELYPFVTRTKQQRSTTT